MSEVSEKLAVLRLADGRGAVGGGGAFLLGIIFPLLPLGVDERLLGVDGQLELAVVVSELLLRNDCMLPTEFFLL